MKKIAIILIIFSVSLISAQDKEQKVKLEQKGDLVEATYYYDNGQVEQHGFYKDEKLHGTWEYYNQEGLKISVGVYKSGKKTGTWYFWNNGNPKEVSYEEGKINVSL